MWPARRQRARAMIFDRSKPRLDADPGDHSPLGVAISAGDRATLSMVQEAIAARRLRLAFQPVVLAAEPARIAFYEGLIRVLEPTGRVIPAKDFMQAVETREEGRQIDCAALELALTTLARRPELRLSVNMSARSIGYPPWIKVLRRGLSLSPKIGERLILEINESSAMLLPEIVAAFMADLQMSGVAFALDDFGSGALAIRYFKDFSFDIVKMDGQFIRGIDRDADNRALSAALLAIGKSFDMFTVANSVETPAEAAVLQKMGVDCLQGYLFGAPSLKPAFEMEEGRKTA
jgi:EAL domain-containing protein (putative c-di-GMP-specific phosphodiesterase class I)